MRDDEHRGESREVQVPLFTFLGAQAGEGHSDRLPVDGPRFGPAAQSAAVPRVIVLRVIPPVRIVAALEKRAAIDRYELRKARMHAGAVQALVVVLPEDLPVALDGLVEAVP